jgi:dipeptidyl aminopeptidase/acylaminoacyl peptidase
LVGEVPFYVAAWWPKGGGLLAFRSMGYCNSCNVDGVTLVSVPLQGPAMDIAPVMTGAGSYSWSSQENLLVGSVHSRFVYDGDPTIFICDVKGGSCKKVAKPRDAADLTPAWSPDGRHIAFARGSVATLGGSGQLLPEIAAWQESLTIWVADADGGNQRRVTSGLSSGYPAWSADGKRLAFVRAGELWSLDLASGAEERQGPLRGRPGYGWIDWSAAVAAATRSEAGR